MTRLTHQTLLVGVAALAAFATVGASPALAKPGSGGSGNSGYSAIPTRLPGNVPSTGFEATATTDFGDQVALGGTARTLTSMTVVMSSWGCESGTWQSACSTTPGTTFSVPLTFTVYEDNNGTAGAVLAQETHPVDIAYRPSASAKCGDGRWWSATDKACYNGFAQQVTMPFSPVTLPDHVIWTVSYNTTHYGSSPFGESAACFTEDGGCGYDSLNVGDQTFAKKAFAGTDVSEDQAFVNGTIESGWTGYRPLGALATG